MALSAVSSSSKDCRLKELILASASPRRKEILEKFDIPFRIEPSPLEEVFTNDPPADQAAFLSKAKIKTLLDIKPDLSSRLVLGADTCIDLDGRIIGKPGNRKEAETILRRFSGRTHLVITALTLYTADKGEYITETQTAGVKFAEIPEDLLSWYLDTGEWIGAAGGYRIQEKGALLVDSIIGDFYTIMGLPIRLFYGMLASQDPRFYAG